MSGLAGLAAQEELEEVQEKRETLSGINMPGFQAGLVNSSTTLSLQSDGYGGCVVLDDGTLWCWGSNQGYALGNGDSESTPASTPEIILGPLGSGAPTQTDQVTDIVVSVTTGVSHNCALVDTGNPVVNSSELWCWGYFSPLGDPNSHYSTTPTRVTTLDGDVTLVASGSQHTCAIIENGSVQCWGANNDGQLGLLYKCVTGSEGECGNNSVGWNWIVASPQYFTLPPGRTAVGLNLWSSNTCVILDDASYICAGGLVGSGTPSYINGTYSIVAADKWSAISSAGELLSLGGNAQLVQHTAWQIDSRNAANTSYSSNPAIGHDAKIRTVSGSTSSTSNSWSPESLCAIFYNGSLGCGSLQEYRDSSNQDLYRGYLYQAWIEAPGGAEVAAISSADSRMVCMALDNGSVQCWGDNSGSYIGDGSTCVYGTSDTTGCTDQNFVNSPRYITLPAGRHVALGEMDSDGDGIATLFDLCPSGVTGWISNPSSDYDSDGCRDSDEDEDDDADGYLDTVDSHPLNPMFHHDLDMDDGWIVGGRYENVSIACTSESVNPISEWTSSSRRAVACTSDHAISPDNLLIDFDTGDPLSVNWNLGDGVTAITSKCAILESGAVRCWGSNSEGQIGVGSNLNNYQTPSTSGNVSFPVNYGAVQIGTYANGAGSMAVLENGDVYLWGKNRPSSGNGLGFSCHSGSYTNGCDGNENLLTPSPMILPVGSQARAIYASSYSYYGHKCVVFDDGTAACVGKNEDGQLGDGTTSNKNTLTPVYLPPGITSNISAMTMVADGYWGEGGTTCALWDNGSIYCWGDNEYGQLGDGTTCPGNNYENNCNGLGDKPIIYDPVVVPVNSFGIALWSNLQDTFCALLNTGGVWCWGSDYSNGTGGYQNLFSLGHFIQPGNRDWDSDGIYNTEDNCADGIQGWSSTSINDFDSDGCIDVSEDDDDDGDSYSDSTEISCGTDPLNNTDIPLDPDNDGLCNAFDLDDDNDGVLDVDDAFPNDEYGFVQLSLGDGFQSGQPQDNSTLGGSGRTICAILTDNTLRCWGNNDVGQIGDGTRNVDRVTPVIVSLPTGKNPVSVSATGSASSHICSTMDDGSLYCWGNNHYGQTGIGTECTYNSYINGCNGAYGISTPTQVNLPVGRTAEAVATGFAHTCAILDDGSVWCWGNNNYGQLGVGNSSNSGNWRFSPSEVIMPSGTSAIAISLGDEHSCMVVDDGRLFCWGNNGYGQLGDGTSTSKNIPTQILSIFQYISVSLGSSHSCAITTLKSLNCWGWNNYQQLGINSGTYQSTTPQYTLLPAGSQVSSVISGYRSSCAILVTMEMYCWGVDDENKLNTEYNCNNDMTNGCYGDHRGTPALVQLPTGRNAIGAIMGHTNTCVLIDNGGIYCFGSNGYGQLGNGSTAGNGPNFVGMPVGISPQTNDRDLDHDGVFNNEDACMEGETGWTSNNTTDNDGDGCQDSSEDLDDDNDFLNDTDEATLGTNSTNPDTDDDGYLDGFDDFPLDDSEWLDTDGDGIGNNADADDDNDGWSDSAEFYCQTDSLNGTDIPGDNDGDGNCDYTDTDDDNDGTPDSEDAFPFDSGADTDTDGDGMPNTLVANYTGNLTEDFDDDNDGWNDTAEVDCGNDPLSNSSTPVDTDGDTFCDPVDVFPNDPSEWADTDGDSVGDNSDEFPLDGTEWTDTDGDGLGDNIDPDADNDGWGDSDEDLCLTDWLDSSSVPGDIDSDGICDALEQDLDNDGWSNANETLCGTDWQDVNSVPLDTDGDMICDLMDGDIDGDLIPNDQDVFPLNPLEWYDFDGDGIGDNTDPDDDNDGCMDVSDDLPFDPTECDDTDGDGTGNNVDVDDDGDGVIDVNDPFPLDGSATVDTDGDGLPDFLNGTSSTGLVEDNDDDNDGYNDTDDAFPLDLSEWLDTDADGVGNNADVNDDGDNCPDVIDAFPLNPAECFDTDGDGIGNNADSDDDNDGWLDGTEMACGTSDPLNASSVPDDFDSDGVCDLMDFDDDNDSIVDASDAFPFDPCASVDTDGDGLPDELFLNCNTTLVEDWDDDNDGYNDTVDLFPQDANEWSDFDMDGFGDNMDTDDDGDMVPDDFDLFPLNSSEWADNDGDGIGDNADEDDDNDGTDDVDDDFPFAFGITTDTDGDGLPDTIYPGYNGTLSEDLDDDGDGVLDIYDQFPLDPTEWSDTDLDGIGNNADSDDDGDGWSDNDEWICGTDTLDANDVPDDSDNDGICDSEDDEDLTTLSGRVDYYLNSPVTVWMALVGILAGMIGGATSTSFRARKERNQLFNEMRDFTDSVRDNEDYHSPRTTGITTVQDSKDSQIKKLIDQGYSEEVAEALLDSQK